MNLIKDKSPKDAINKFIKNYRNSLSSFSDNTIQNSDPMEYLLPTYSDNTQEDQYNSFNDLLSNTGLDDLYSLLWDGNSCNDI